MGLGDKLHELRTQRGMTLEEVGNKVGVGKSTVRKWEQGIIQNMRRDKIEALAKLFGVSPSELLDFDTAETKESNSYYLNQETVKAAQELLENKDLALLFDAARDASAEDLKTVHTMLLALKNKEK